MAEINLISGYAYIYTVLGQRPVCFNRHLVLNLYQYLIKQYSGFESRKVRGSFLRII